jgi:hypothetical protein
VRIRLEGEDCRICIYHERRCLGAVLIDKISTHLFGLEYMRDVKEPWNSNAMRTNQLQNHATPALYRRV